MSNELIVIIGASGKQASHLIPHLLERQLKLRLVVNSESSSSRLKESYLDCQVVRADLTSPEHCRAIVKDASAVFHVGPPMHSREREIGLNMVDAAVQENHHGGNVRHFVYSSMMNTQLRKLLNHDCKRYVEEHLIESGLPYTIMNPTNTMESLPQQWIDSEAPVWKCIHNPDCANSLLALRDYGEAVAKVLLEREKHFFAKYDCASTFPVPYSKVVPEMGRVLGKSIKIEWLPYDQAVQARLAAGLGGELASQGTRDIVERLVVYSNDHAITANPNVLRWLIGREPTSALEWIKLQVGST